MPQDQDSPPSRVSGKKHGLKSRWSRLTRWWKHLGRNTRFGIIAAGLLLFGATSLGVFYFTQPKSEPSIEVTRRPDPPAPKTVASPLTGVQVEPALAARPVTGIMIENSTAARPQSGLHEAGVIFEAIAEGGITRFLCLYQEGRPGYVGPVRSLRPYYLDFLMPFDGAIAHVGGSPDALSQVRSPGNKDLDQFFNAGSYWRVSSRAAPHNMYTNFERLDALNQAKGYTSSKVSSWPRKDDSKLATPTARTIDFNISNGAAYRVQYSYDPATNTYHRTLGGAPHHSTSSEADRGGKILTPKVVIAIITSYSTAGKYSVYGVTGSGAMLVFQDGGVTAGTWTKDSRNAQYVFKDSAGAPLKLNTGQTWVTMLGSADKATYAP